MNSWEVLEWAMYQSYCAQRDKWFDPSATKPKTLKAMRLTYPSLDEYEQKYMKEQNERYKTYQPTPRVIEYNGVLPSLTQDTSLRKNGS